MIFCIDEELGNIFTVNSIFALSSLQPQFLFQSFVSTTIYTMDENYPSVIDDTSGYNGVFFFFENLYF